MNHNISIQINLWGITGRIQQVLRKAVSLVAIGLNAKDGITNDTLTIPDVTMHHQFDESNKWSEEEAKTAWQHWVLLNGFREVSEALSGLLEEVQSVLAHWEVLGLQKNQAVLVEDWNEIIIRRSNQFHRRTLPQKIEFLEKKYSFILNQDLIRQVLTMNAARNCLTHRNGTITSIDIDASGYLTLEWSALVLLAKTDGESQEVSLPYHAKAGTELSLGVRQKSKSFAIGERITLSIEEFTQLCWTLFQLALSCARELETYGKERGIVFQNSAD